METKEFLLSAPLTPTPLMINSMDQVEHTLLMTFRSCQHDWSVCVCVSVCVSDLLEQSDELIVGRSKL